MRPPPHGRVVRALVRRNRRKKTHWIDPTAYRNKTNAQNGKQYAACGSIVPLDRVVEDQAKGGGLPT